MWGLTMKISKIISGGQTGADQGGVMGAKEWGCPTGGTAPRGFRTSNGPEPTLEKSFGLSEDGSPQYQPRTRRNVIDSDITLIFGNDNSAGCKLTKRFCKENNKPFILIREWSDQEFINVINTLENMGDNLIINVAGNREQKNPGITMKVFGFVYRILEVLDI